MAVWYLVKRLDTGEITGHNTWDYSPVTTKQVAIGEVEVQRHRDGTPHHLIVHVDARDDKDALFMAETAFYLIGENEVPGRRKNDIFLEPSHVRSEVRPEPITPRR